MIKKILQSFFSSPNYAFMQSSVFQHACATPLTILMSNLEEKITDEGKFKNQRNTLTSLKAVKRLSSIVSSISGKNDEYKNFKIKPAVNEILCLLDSKAKRNIVSRMLIDENLFLFGNKLYFQEALTCVLNNSIESYKKTDKKPVSIIIRKIKDSLKIDIVDYGSGMNFFMQKIVLFEGVSTKKDGMGLGLYFAKKAVENIFSGKMIMKSAINFGTHITWIIPLAKPYTQSLLQS